MVDVTIDDLTLLVGAIADGDLIEIDRQGAPDISRKVTKINFVTDIDNADIAAGAAIATSKLADAANFVLIDQANTYNNGLKQTFNPSSTTPGINFGSEAGDPSTPANGDVWYNSTSEKFRGRENGANADLLGSDISVRVRKSAGQSIANNSNTILTWNTEDYDTDAMHDNAVNNSRLTFQTAGKFLVICNNDWAIGSVGVRSLVIIKNGVDRIAASKTDASSLGSSFYSASVIDDFIVGDFVECEVLQSSGGSLNIDATLGTNFEAQKIDAGD